MSQWQPPTSPVFADPDSLDWALKHIEEFGDTVFLPRCFEYEAIRHGWPKVKTWILNQDLRGWSALDLRRLLASKSTYSYRYVTQLDPIENLIFTSLIHQIGGSLEAVRLPNDRKTIFSWRFAPLPTGQMYDPDVRWYHFNERCSEMAAPAGCKFVVVADIADFFSRIYSHPLEQVLDRATSRSPQAYCVLRMLKNWNRFVSYGLPVGLSGSRLLSEALLTDLDSALIGTRRPFCRYSDDIRIFCSSGREARTALEHLATTLFNTQGLTLQPSKTLVLPKADYLKRFATSGERLELESLTNQLHELLEAAGYTNDYEDEIDIDSLPEDVREEIDRLNMIEVLSEQITSKTQDFMVMRFVLHRLRQLRIEEAVDEVLNHLSELNPAIDLVVDYLKALRSTDEKTRLRIGRKVLASAKKPATGSYERLCLLSLFTNDSEFNHADHFEPLYGRFSDAPTRRELILAMGRAGKAHWFRANRFDYQNLESWSRRAFLAAFSCVDSDAATHFYRSLRNGANILEEVVIDWVQAFPFAQ
jgi:hypothetical protein